MMLSRRETMVGAVLGLFAPRPPPPTHAEVQAELVKLRKALDEMIVWYNSHTHYHGPGPTAPPLHYDPLEVQEDIWIPIRRKTSGG